MAPQRDSVVTPPTLSAPLTSESCERVGLHPSAIRAIRLLALTGLRRSELLGSPHAERRGGVDGLRWKHVDLDAGILTLEDSKTGSQRRVIGQAAVDLLREAKPKSARPGDCVCPGPRAPGRPYRAINNARRLIWRAADLPLERGCDLHSLRHTFASLGAHFHNSRYAAFVAPSWVTATRSALSPSATSTRIRRLSGRPLMQSRGPSRRSWALQIRQESSRSGGE